MKKLLFSIIVFVGLIISSLILNSSENQKLVSNDPVIIAPPVKGPVPTQDRPTKKLAVISNFDLVSNSNTFTV